MSGRLPRLVTLALAIVGALALVVTSTPIANLVARPLLAAASTPGPADVIVVLSGGRYDDGSLNDASIERTVAAVRLFRRGLAPRVLFTGGPCCGASASALMARLSIELGLSPDVILLEEQSRRTAENARFVAAMLRERRLGRTLLVTSPVHLLRARLAFEAAGVEVIPVRASDRDLALVSGAVERLALLRDATHEILGLALYRLRGWI